MLSEIPSVVQDFFQSLPSWVVKLIVVAAALAVVAIAKVASQLVRRLIQLLIDSTSGPLKYVFRDRKKSAALSDLVINLVKYAVYFAALYVAVSQFGVPSSAYLAVLFLFGLAVAIGSQGIVEDVVRGFFLRLDGLLGVGDMVEVAGHVGRVEAVNARTITLRNSLDERVVISNRTVQQVGTYSGGYVTAFVDVPVPSGAGDDIKELIRNTARRVQKQYNALVMGTPQILGFIRVGEDELYVRVSFRIWPRENWVIEREFVNRVLAALRERKVPVSQDQMSIYFRAGTQPSPARTRGRRRMMRRTQ